MLSSWFAAGPSQASTWDPDNGLFGKAVPRDVRIVTYNVRDTLRSTSVKTNGFNGWSALVRIVSVLEPDVVLLQECGDNSAFVDSVANLHTVVELFVEGGVDVFMGNTPVTSYMQLYRPEYQPAAIFVSQQSDGFNRNVIWSLFPDADLNGDTKSRLNDILPILSPDAYAVGGTGGIRGYQFMEIDLPDEIYRGNLVTGNGHLKSGSSSGDAIDRRDAARNIAYFVDYFYNGAGQGIPDPNGAILDIPAATQILDPWTPVVVGGDLNEDELTNGTRGPAAWLSEAAVTLGSDGTDRDRSDALRDDAREPFTNGRATIGSVKFDYVISQDSIANVRREFILDTEDIPDASLPHEFDGMLFPGLASGLASDHRPVVTDLILPLWHDGDGDGDVDLYDVAQGMTCPGNAPGDSACQTFDTDRSGEVTAADYASIDVVLTGPLADG